MGSTAYPPSTLAAVTSTQDAGDGDYHAGLHNSHDAQAAAIVAELGAAPASTFANVAARLSALDTTVAGKLGSTGLWTTPVEAAESTANGWGPGLAYGVPNGPRLQWSETLQMPRFSPGGMVTPSTWNAVASTVSHGVPNLALVCGAYCPLADFSVLEFASVLWSTAGMQVTTPPGGFAGGRLFYVFVGNDVNPAST